MDAALTPPLRIQPISATPISTKDAQKRIDRFLAAYQARSLAANGGADATLTVQLQKLSAALKEEESERK